MPIGFRVKTSIERASVEDIDLFRGLPASTVSDSMMRHGAMHPSIKPVKRPGPQLVGPAFTVRTRSADNLMAHKAIGMAEPGDVLVIEVDGQDACAILGEIMCRQAKKRGIAGIVIDGLIRDSDALAEMGFPVYATGASPLGPWKDGPGEIGFPVVCGGINVNPGDIIVADGDGVVVVPKNEAKEIARMTTLAVAKEHKTFEDIENGAVDRSWIDKTLRERGCEFVE